jgi:hypothetical protein
VTSELVIEQVITMKRKTAEINSHPDASPIGMAWYKQEQWEYGSHATGCNPSFKGCRIPLKDQGRETSEKTPLSLGCNNV